MSEAKYVLLIIISQTYNGTTSQITTHSFAISEEYKDFPEQYLRKAIKHFLNETDEGKQTLVRVDNDFNWDDINCIPQEFFASWDIFPLFSSGYGPYAMDRFQFIDYVTKEVSGYENLAMKEE